MFPLSARLSFLLLAASSLLSSPLRGQTTQPDTVMSLGDVIRHAMRNNASVLADRAAIEQANARVSQARAALLPTLNSTLGNRQRTFNSAELGISLPTAPGMPPIFDPEGEVLGPISLYDARIRIGQPIYAPAARAQLRSAHQLVNATTADAERARDQLGVEAALAFVRMQRAAGHVEARASDSILATELLATAREQLQSGIGIALDVTRAESQLSAARAQLMAARAERRRAQIALSNVMGLDLERVVREQSTLQAGDVPDPLPSANAIQLAQSQRPELRAIDARLAALRSQRRSVQAERLPALSLIADNGMIGRAVDELRYTYSWGLQVSLPILDVRRSGRGAEQTAAIREAEERRRSIERSIAADVMDALVDMASSQEQVQAARDRVTLAEREVTQARDRFQGGVASNADVVSASLSLNAARSALVDALALLQRSRISLARAQGTLDQLP